MKIFIVATYSAMTNPIKKLISKYNNIKIDYGVGILNDGLDLAIEAEKQGYDAVISRGGTARLLKKHLDIPVIDAKPSGNDLLKGILIAKNNDVKTSVIAFSNVTDGAIEIIRLLDLDYKITYIKNDLDLSSLLIDLKDKGYKQILGDSLAVKKAKDLDFNTVLFQSSYETIESSLDYAIMLLNQVRKTNKIDIIKSKILSDFLSDYLIMKNNKIIFSKYSHFNKIPVSYEKCINLRYKMEKGHNNNITEKIGNISINIYRTCISKECYYLYEFKKVKQIKEKLPKAYSHIDINKDLMLVDKSSAMKKLINKSYNLEGANEVVFLVDDNHYSLNEVLSSIFDLDSDNNLLIDLNELDRIDNKQYLNLHSNYKNVIFLNLNNREELYKLEFSQKNNSRNIFVILKKNSKLLDYVSPSKTLIIPNTRERKEDLETIFNNYIAYYHEKYGTSPMKFQEGVFNKYNNLLNENLDFLLEALRFCILNTEDLVISGEYFIESIKKHKNKKDVTYYANKTLDQIEKDVIKFQLKKEEYNQSKVSKKLGISRSTLWRKMKKYEL